MSADIGEIKTPPVTGYQSSSGGCKGICSRYKAQKQKGIGRYVSGQRRCQICEIYMKVEGLWCPCCGYRLRTKPRNRKYKEILRAKQESEKQ